MIVNHEAVESLKEKIYLDALDLKRMDLSIALEDPDNSSEDIEKILHKIKGTEHYSDATLDMSEPSTPASVVIKRLTIDEKLAFYNHCYAKYLATVNQEIGYIIYDFLVDKFSLKTRSSIRYITSFSRTSTRGFYLGVNLTIVDSQNRGFSVQDETNLVLAIQKHFSDEISPVVFYNEERVQ